MTKLIIGLNSAGDDSATSLIEKATEQLTVLKEQCVEPVHIEMYTWLGEQDLMANQSDTIRPPVITVEICTPPGMKVASILPAINSFIASLVSDIDVKQSTLLYGVENIVVEGERNKYCYRYFMKRRDDMCHAEYIDYYVNIHAKFGHMVQKISSYRQLHIDQSVSKSLNKTLGLTYMPFDSVTELHIPSYEGFLEAAATAEVTTLASEDEVNFVAGSSSQMFTSLRR